MESDSAVSTSSVKRSTADNSSNEHRARGSLPDPPSTSSPSSDLNLGIDSYMAESGALHIPPIVSLPLYEEIAIPPVSLMEKYQVVKKGKERKMEVGETWYLVSRVWYKRWEKACTGEVDKDGPVREEELGPVDNSGLLDSFGNLRPSQAEGVDLEYVPEDTWNLFVLW
jgi:ubiquitin carboxyl-terminal hydrolase 4/11/15